MDARALTDQAHALLDAARDARSRGDGAAVLAHLAQAQDLVAGADQPELLGRIAWRRAKAAYDFDDIDTMIDAVTPLLDAGTALQEPTSVRALPQLARRWWDERGYDDDRVCRLWVAWADRYQAEGDPWLAASGHMQAAWHHACAGEHDPLDALIERYLAMDPRRFGSGPHRHPRASDAAASIWWVQVDLVRTGLWQAAWAGRSRRAADLVDALLDAAAAAELDLNTDVWSLDALARVAVAFPALDLGDWLAPWRRALETLDHPRAAFHRHLAAGLDATDTRAAVQHHRAAVQAATDGGFGHEWRVDAGLRLAEALSKDGAADLAEHATSQALDHARRFGVRVFLPR